MPLIAGYSRDTVNANISEMLRNGHSNASAVAAAMAHGRMSYFRRFPHGALPVWMAYPKTHRLRAYYDHLGNPIKGNPITQNAEIRQGAKLIESFSGHKARIVGKITIPPPPKTALAIGRVLGIIYETKRDGVKENYIHHFAAASRPLLAATHDGKRLLLIGGSYNFTERGIEDAPFRKTRKGV